MKRMAIAVSILAIGAAGCGSSTTSPSANTLQIFTVPLLPANETPPIGNAENTGHGTAVITIHTDTNTIDFAFSADSFPANTNVILAHIHPGAAGVPGPALIGVPGLSVGTPLLLTNGGGTYNANGVAAANDAATAASRIQSILAAPQNFYFNVHTTNNPGGVMRGQLQ
jgi:hypothetical protein